MKLSLAILSLFLYSNLNAQTTFNPAIVEKELTQMPAHKKDSVYDLDVMKAIETIDKNFRKISDSIYSYESKKYTIFQVLLIETNDSMFINPWNYGDKIKLKHIVFGSNQIAARLAKIQQRYSPAEKKKMYFWIQQHFDYFSPAEKKFESKAVRIRSIKFPDKRYVHAGIDIYGAHFLWTIDKERNWEVIKVESLYIY